MGGLFRAADDRRQRGSDKVGELLGREAGHFGEAQLTQTPETDDNNNYYNNENDNEHVNATTQGRYMGMPEQEEAASGPVQQYDGSPAAIRQCCDNTRTPLNRFVNNAGDISGELAAWRHAEASIGQEMDQWAADTDGGAPVWPVEHSAAASGGSRTVHHRNMHDMVHEIEWGTHQQSQLAIQHRDATRGSQDRLAAHVPPSAFRPVSHSETSAGSPTAAEEEQDWTEVWTGPAAGWSFG